MLRKKIQSEQGASLLLSLLVFLVCAMVSISLIAAATAASGIASGRAALDQRYYSVTSAAELIRDQFDGKEVTVTVVIERDAAEAETDREVTYAPADGFLKEQTVRVLNSTSDSDWSSTNTVGDIPSASSMTLTIADGSDLTDVQKSALAVEVTATPSDRGMTVEVANVKKAEDNNYQYVLWMNWTADVLKDVTRSPNVNAEGAVTGYTDYITYRVTWKAVDIQTGKRDGTT